MPTASSCLGFAVDCGTLWKGAGVAIMGLILFIGSVYLLLSAILGRTMGYLVLMVSLTGWLAIQSSLWLFGFWSQGIETPTNLGPRGSEPAWIALEASPNSTSDRYEVFSTYPDQPWAPPGSADTADIQSVGGAVTSFLAEQTNEELGLAETDPTAITGTQFAIDSIDFADGRGRQDQGGRGAVPLHRRRSRCGPCRCTTTPGACPATPTCSCSARSSCS